MELLAHRRFLPVVAGLLAAACTVDRTRECASEADCLNSDGFSGLCVSSPASSSSWCVFDDNICVSELRWSPLAGDGLSESCVDVTAGPIWSRAGGGMLGDSAVVGVEPFASKIAVAGSFSGELQFAGCPPVLSVNQSLDVFVAMLDRRGVCLYLESFGSPGTEVATAIVNDGPLTVAGHFDTNLIFGSMELIPSGGTDVFIANVPGPFSGGAPPTARAIGGPGNQYATGIAAGTGSYLVGYFDGDIDFGDGVLIPSQGGDDLFVVSLQYAFANTYGGASHDHALAVAVDGEENVLVTGDFRGDVDFGGFVHGSDGKGKDVFVLQLDAAGNRAWSIVFGGEGDEIGTTIAVDASRNVIVGGWFTSPTDFGSGSFVTPSLTDAFVAKFSPTGEHQWSQAIGTYDVDEVRAVSVGASSVFAAGTFRGMLPLGPDVLHNQGEEDVFMVELALDTGAYRRSDSIGGAGSDSVASVAGAESGHVVLGGTFESAVQIAGGDPSTSAGLADFFAAFYAPWPE